MDWTVPRVDGVALGAEDRKARHCDWLAAEGLSHVLDLESPSRPARTAGPISGDSRADPPHEPRESRLGRAAHSRGTTEAWHRHRRDQREQVPDAQPTWRTFLENHLQTLVSVDFFTVPTIRFQVLYVFLVLAHERRRIVHFAVTAHPTAEWTAHQLREAFPWESAPRYLLRDRDRIFGHEFVHQVKVMGIKQVLSAPRSPWQRAYIERLIGSIRRECLDHLIVFSQRSLRRHLQAYVDYYHGTRTHLALQKDCPEPRAVQPPDAGQIVSIREVGGLHHRYERRAA